MPKQDRPIDGPTLTIAFQVQFDDHDAATRWLAEEFMPTYLTPGDDGWSDGWHSAAPGKPRWHVATVIADRTPNKS